MTTKTEI